MGTSSFIDAKAPSKKNKAEREDTGISSHKDIEGFVQWIDEDEAANLAHDAYNMDRMPVDGWNVVEVYDDKSSGFRAKLYEKNGNYAFVTAGTNAKSGRDWRTNIKQQLGMETTQYEQSTTIAKDLAKKYDNLVFIGHSLGGGLASANSRATGVDAISFNSSALSSRYNNNLYNSKVAAYISNGDILDYVNEVLLRQRPEGEIIRRDVASSKWPNFQGIPGSGLYQVIRGIKIHTDINPIK